MFYVFQPGFVLVYAVLGDALRHCRAGKHRADNPPYLLQGTERCGHTGSSPPCTVQVPRLAKDYCVEEVRLYKCGACDDYLNLQEEIRFLKDGAHSSQLGPSKQDLRVRLEA